VAQLLDCKVHTFENRLETGESKSAYWWILETVSIVLKSAIFTWFLFVKWIYLKQVIKIMKFCIFIGFDWIFPMVYFTANATNLCSTLAVIRVDFICSTEQKENRWKPARQNIILCDKPTEKVNNCKYFGCVKVKKKAIPITDFGGLWGCEILRISHCLDNRLTDGGKVVSPTPYPPHFTPQKHYYFSASGTHFC
jgi:hypothetical protein